MRLNPRLCKLTCSVTGEEVDARGFARPVGLCACCPAPGKPVEVSYAIAPGDAWIDRDAPGMWRYGPLLPVLDPPEGYAGDVGRAVIVPAPRLGAPIGVDLEILCEGTNPSGSFKDRGLAVAVALGVTSGAKRFCLPTQGNAGVAACLFSARLGLPGCLVYMPDSHAGSTYHRACLHFGGEVRFAGANIAAAGQRMRQDLAAPLASGELVDVSTFYEPGRLEGKKTMGLAIAEASAPEVVVYPTGGGTGLVGIWKAFEELAQLGVAARRPRMIAVQSEACAPVVASFEAGLAEVRPVESRGTIADGLDVPRAIMGHRMLSVLRESGGFAIAVPDAAIVSAWRDLGRSGFASGLEAGAALAALRASRAGGRIPEGARVLLVDTGGHAAALGKLGAATPGS